MGQIMADMGADVVKVERPDSGDDTRSWGPPFIDGADGNAASSAYFEACNHGKRSVTADLSTPDGQALVHRLAGHADVLIENFMVGSLSRFKLDAESLTKRYPRLIYCSITGFGQTGPYADRPGYDFIIQAMSGLMMMNGTSIVEPRRVPVPVSDLFTGLYGVIGVLAALKRRAETNQGCTLDLSLLDTQIGAIGQYAINYLLTDQAPSVIGNAHSTIAPQDVFLTSDRPVAIIAGNDNQFRRLANALNLSHLASDPRFSSNSARVENRTALTSILSDALRPLTAEDAMQRLSQARVPASIVNSLHDALRDSHVMQRGLRVDVPSPESRDGNIPLIRMPILFDGKPSLPTKSAPALGEDSLAVETDPQWGGITKTGSLDARRSAAPSDESE
jgi:crotonobetainyl-CoA:carnitine CoA-transferase CaiB-like acyl-CoA transferase